MRTRAVIAATITGIVLATAPAALAGTISGTAFMDYNSNGAKNAGGFTVGASSTATDVGVAGVAVVAYDASGAQVASGSTAADGTYALTTPGSGAVRVQFTAPAGYEPSFRGANDGTSVQFVNGSGTGVDFGVVKVDEYCQDNPDLMTCLQQATGMVGNPSFAARPGAFRVPSTFYGANTFTADGRINSAWPVNSPTDSAIVAPFSSIGATFGVGVDRTGNAYYGTFVKRHSPYGPAGAVNAVYRVNVASGVTSTFVVLGNATLPAHVQAAPTGWPDYAADGYRADSNPNDVYHRVGRAGLGDVDVTPDGSTLLAVEMTQGASKLWRVPIAGAGAGVTAGTPVSTAIPAPATFGGVQCIGNWHPMGIGVRGSRILVGGVCGGTETQWVANPADQSVNSRTNAAAFVLEFDSASAGFQTIAAFSLSYPKGHNNDRIDTIREWTNSSTGLWHNWFDGDGAQAPVGDRKPRQQPMLANIEILDDGDLALGFRDRGNDQTKTASIDYESTPASPVQASNLISGAETLRLCADGSGGYVRESNGACGAQTGANYAMQMSDATGSPSAASLRADSPLFYMTAYAPDWGGATDGHAYTSLGGIASVPGAPRLWTTLYDPDDYSAQGLRVFGPCAARSGSGTCGPAGASEGAALATVELSWGTYGWNGSAFGKGNGLGDLEVLCDAAPVQVGNRIWIDTNANGVQDPGESPIAGVTLRLYDSGGSLVGTALTGADGTYYFSSNSTAPAAGDGTNAGGGLRPGEAFTLKMDNPADFAAGGPLAAYSLTTANTSSPGNAANSKATLQGGFPTITIGARTAGQNNHTFDIGFVPPASVAGASSATPSGGTATTSLVAVGNYVWVDLNRNGIQDEPPLKGVRVVLLTPQGKRARNAAGTVVPVATTDAQGRYLFDGLAPGAYRVRFTLPSGYRFTVPAKPNAKRNSNPVASKVNPRVGTTPVFRVFDATRGNTVRNTNPKINAAYIDPTIDAGVVQVRGPLGNLPVTG